MDNQNAEVREQAAPVSEPTKQTQSTQDQGGQEPHWLKPRLDRERESVLNSVLKELGVDNVAKAKEAIDSLKQIQMDKLSEEEKLRAKSSELENLLKSTSARVSELETAVKVRAEAELASLNEKARETVAAMAGDDPARVLATIEKLRAGGLLNEQKPKPPIQSPISTAPAAAAPAPTAAANENVVAKYREMQAKDPMAAGLYLLKHAKEIAASNNTNAR